MLVFRLAWDTLLARVDGLPEDNGIFIEQQKKQKQGKKYQTYAVGGVAYICGFMVWFTMLECQWKFSSEDISKTQNNFQIH